MSSPEELATIYKCNWRVVENTAGSYYLIEEGSLTGLPEIEQLTDPGDMSTIKFDDNAGFNQGSNQFVVDHME